MHCSSLHFVVLYKFFDDYEVLPVPPPTHTHSSSPTPTPLVVHGLYPRIGPPSLKDETQSPFPFRDFLTVSIRHTVPVLNLPSTNVDPDLGPQGHVLLLHPGK